MHENHQKDCDPNTLNFKLNCEMTCKGEEHPSRAEQVVPRLPEGEDDTQGAQDHKEQTEDGDGCC